MNRIRLVHVFVPLIAALAALLVCAAVATAETWTGETTTVASSEGAPTPETTLVKASAAYEPTGGSLGFAVVTSAPPQPELGGKPNNSGFSGMFLNTSGACTSAGVEASLKDPERASIRSTVAFESFYREPTTAQGVVGSPPATLLIQKSVSDATTTFTAQSAALKGQGFNCAVINAVDGKAEGATKMVYALAPPPLPPPAPTPPGPPAPAPAALSIAKLKPRTLKVDQSKRVKITVTNTGGTDAAQGSLRVKAPKGVVVKPERQKLPALAPGASWTVSVRFELTKKAKEKSTITLTGSAAGATGADSTLVLKLDQTDPQKGHTASIGVVPRAKVGCDLRQGEHP